MMPGPIVQAHTGGIAQRENRLKVETNAVSVKPSSKEEDARKPQHHHQQDEDGREPQQHHHHQEDGEEEGGHKEEISCNANMHIRMPGPIVQASHGGISPIMDNLRSETNTTQIMRQPVLRWPTEEDHRSNEGHGQPGENAKEED
jgi:hypothetical protein